MAVEKGCSEAESRGGDARLLAPGDKTARRSGGVGVRGEPFNPTVAAATRGGGDSELSIGGDSEFGTSSGCMRGERETLVCVMVRPWLAPPAMARFAQTGR